MKDTKKQTIILSVVAIVMFAILIIGATYAYFQAQTGASKSTDVKVTTYTTDVFTFTTGDAINIALTQSDFASGKGNAVGNTFTKATLTANNKTNTATMNYYVYLNIENNTFTYSINESTPELILTVIGPDGNEVTNIEGLTHTSVTDGKNQVITGFDVTSKSGLITIANTKDITASPSKEEQYTIKLTFVNYNANQNGNAGAGFSAKVMIQTEMIPFHETCNDNTLACHTAKLYTGTQGANNIYYHDASLTDGAGDNSYRYAGASESVNNFVCFGTNTTPCPTDNLYRIIGVFGDKVKLIKSTSVGDKAWDSNNKNTWSTSSLNNYLNNEFINTLGDLANKIDTTTWKVGGFYDIYQPAKTVYQNEIVQPATDEYSTETECSAKIGLMYASDYGFAAASSAWTTILANYETNGIPNTNWMYMDIGATEWTISRCTYSSTGAFGVAGMGSVFGYHRVDDNVTTAYGVRPVFSLTSSVNYASGSGTAADPILVN